MGGKKKGKTGSGGKKGSSSAAGAATSGASLTNGEVMLAVDPEVVRYMHAKIRPFFSDGRRVEDTYKAIANGQLKAGDLPQIVVVQGDNGEFYSMNNRRLWVFKKLRQEGLLDDNKVLVRVRAMPTSKRLRDKFTPERCSLTAKFMRERPAAKSSDDLGEHEEEAGDDDDGELPAAALDDIDRTSTAADANAEGHDYGADHAQAVADGEAPLGRSRGDDDESLTHATQRELDALTLDPNNQT